MLYMMNLPLSTTTLQATPEKPVDHSSEIGSPVNCNSEEMMASPREPDVLKTTELLHETENNSPPSASSETAWSVMILWKYEDGCKPDQDESAPTALPDELLLPQCWFCLHNDYWIEDAFLLFTIAAWAYDTQVH